jgi:hypothetical protein
MDMRCSATRNPRRGKKAVFLITVAVSLVLASIGCSHRQDQSSTGAGQTDAPQSGKPSGTTTPPAGTAAPDGKG